MPKVVDIQERRAELAAAAAQLIARAGVGAATMREVAAEAGWTTVALTHYFS
ncbi:MAG: TetR family transcriptional regulator, partial [Ilumatobacteraceae bacterium]